jgi:hypothetical protein
MNVFDLARQATAHAQLVSLPRRRTGSGEGFYEMPESLYTQAAPGELLKAEPIDAYLVPGVRLRARAWRMLYRSTGALGEPTLVSGTLLMPSSGIRAAKKDHRAVPLIGYAIGTHGIGDNAAPSRLLQRGLDWEASLMAMALARGWALAITDYQGLGTPGDHTYMVGRTLGPNVLDAMRAARQIAPVELTEDGPAGILGYSEGGAAAAWAAQLQPTYAPDLPLFAVSAGAAAGDLEAATPNLDGTFFSFFIAYGGIGYAAAYPELDIDRYLTDKGRKMIPMLRESTVLQAITSGPKFAHATDMTEPNVLELPEWRARLRENRLGTIKPAAPVLLYHAKRDQIVHFDQSVNLQNDWRALGGDVRLYVTRGGVDHISAAFTGTPVAIDWLARRLASRRGTRLAAPAFSGTPVPADRIAA